MAYPPAVVRAAIDLCNEGHTVHDAAATLGVTSYSTVAKWVRRWQATGWYPPDVTCPAAVHDTMLAYKKGCRCPKARKINAAYNARWRRRYYLTGEKSLRPVTGTQRRVQGLYLLGWRSEDISELCNIPACSISGFAQGRNPMVTADTERRIIKATRALVAMGQGPSARTRGRARSMGYVPLMAWNNIDDPDEQPDGVSTGKVGHGKWRKRLPEVDELWRLLRQEDGNFATVAHRFDVQPDSVRAAYQRGVRAGLIPPLPEWMDAA